MGQQRRRCLLPDRDIYRVINELDPATVEALGERLEFRGSDATFNQMRETYFDQLPLVTAETVLDLGCGTGVEVRALLKREAFGGHVVAIDHSPALIETARRLAEEEQFGERIEYRIGDVHRLDLRDASYDIVIAHTLLSHVADPPTVLREIARVTRPGGSVAIFDGDYASWTWWHPEPSLAAVMTLAEVCANPHVMRELPLLLDHVGLKLVDTQAHVYAEIGSGRFFAGAAETYGPLIARAGAVDAADADRWLDDQRRAVESRTFFAACNYYAFLAERPASAA
jgi:SAM-dependent methyltransferase